MTAVGKKREDELEPISVTDQKEHGSEYKLSNGSVLRMRIVYVDVSRSDTFDDAGNPVCQLKNAIVIDVKAPNRMK